MSRTTISLSITPRLEPRVRICILSEPVDVISPTGEAYTFNPPLRFDDIVTLNPRCADDLVAAGVAIALDTKPERGTTSLGPRQKG